MRRQPLMRVKTAGYSERDELSVDVGPARCGDIVDGLAFWHDNNGGWAIQYTDIIAIARAAAKKRGYRLEVSLALDAALKE